MSPLTGTESRRIVISLTFAVRELSLDPNPLDAGLRCTFSASLGGKPMQRDEIEPLSESVAVVTGAATGIGAGIAERLGEEGACVVVSGLPCQTGEEVRDRIRQAGGEAEYVDCDIRNPDAVTALVEATVNRFGQLDIVVNNAAVQPSGGVEATDLDTFGDVLTTNLRGYWLLIREAADHLSSGGSVVNISSNHGDATMPNHFPYNVSKAAVDGLTRAAAVDLGRRGIRVNGVAPGWVRVERTEGQLSGTDETELEEIHPVGRLGTPEDIAGAVAWLASPDAAFVTGVTVLVDGGRHAVMQDDVFKSYQQDIS